MVNLEILTEPKIYFDQDMAEAELYRMAVGMVAVYSSRSAEKQTPNEDAAAIFPVDAQSAVLVIADGVGGVPAGELASNMAVRSVQVALRDVQRNGTQMRTAILNGIEHANQTIQGLGVGAATTLAVVEIQGDSIRPYHVGDSAILVVGQRGKIKLQSVSHSPMGFAVESGLIDEAEAMDHEDRHLVSNVIGTPEMRIEVGPTVQLAPKDTLLLASDGLIDNLHTDELVERVRKGSLEAAAQRLAHDARQRMSSGDDGSPSKPDDLTFITFRLRV